MRLRTIQVVKGVKSIDDSATSHNSIVSVGLAVEIWTRSSDVFPDEPE